MGRSAYAAARARHAAARAEAYEIVRADAVANGACGPDLRFTDVDGSALAVWQRTWSGVHPHGAGGWKWAALIERLPRRAAILPVAIWYGGDLCGLALGQASRRRRDGTRHTVTLTYVERRPEPPSVPLRGMIISLSVAVARAYGLMMGARRLRLRNPDRHLLRYYRRLGFEIAWSGREPEYCEREIDP